MGIQFTFQDLLDPSFMNMGKERVQLFSCFELLEELLA
jgi:hypothetical protein